jgi:hypothetical protein
MRLWLLLTLAPWVLGCTNDYSSLRFPKGAIVATDAGVDDGAADGD